MAIEFKCSCGATCRADEAKAGTLFHCEACGLDLPVPAPGTPSSTESPGASPPDAAAAGAPPKISVSGAAVEEFKAQARDRSGLKEMLTQLHADKAPADPDAPVAEVVSGPAPSLADEFKAQVGKRDSFNAMMSQLHGVEPPPEKPAAAAEAPGGVGVEPGAAAGSPAAPAAGSIPAGSIPMGSTPAGSVSAGSVAASLKARGQAPPVRPMPKSRAQHHFAFKKKLWLPALIIAGVCVLTSAYAFTLFFRGEGATVASVVPPDVVIKEPEVVKDAQGDQWAIPRGSTAVPHPDGTMWSKDAQGQEKAALKIVRDARDRAWAVPPGKTLTVSKSGNVFYQDDSGFDVSPESAERWLYIQNQIDQRLDKMVATKAGFRHDSLWFGCGLLAVGLVLGGLGIWLRKDVIQARLEMAAEAEKAEQAAPVKPVPVEPAPGGPNSGKK